MDGTILHTMRYWRLTTIEMLLGRNIFPSPEQMSRVWRTSSRALCREVLLEHGIDLSEWEILRELEGYMLHHYLNDAKMKAHADEYLQKLHSNGIPMCIATAAPRDFARQALQRLGLDHYFEFITDCYEQEMRKDDPEFFHRMEAKLGVKVEEMCVFEDALYAVRGAKKAGCSVVAIRDYTQEQDLSEILKLADACVTGYEELIGSL